MHKYILTELLSWNSLRHTLYTVPRYIIKCLQAHLGPGHTMAEVTVTVLVTRFCVWVQNWVQVGFYAYVQTLLEITGRDTSKLPSTSAIYSTLSCSPHSTIVRNQVIHFQFLLSLPLPLWLPVSCMAMFKSHLIHSDSTYCVVCLTKCDGYCYFCHGVTAILEFTWQINNLTGKWVTVWSVHNMCAPIDYPQMWDSLGKWELRLEPHACIDTSMTELTVRGYI